jgi:hypothetical protein
MKGMTCPATEADTRQLLSKLTLPHTFADDLIHCPPSARKLMNMLSLFPYVTTLSASSLPTYTLFSAPSSTSTSMSTSTASMMTMTGVSPSPATSTSLSSLSPVIPSLSIGSDFQLSEETMKRGRLIRKNMCIKISESMCEWPKLAELWQTYASEQYIITKSLRDYKLRLQSFIKHISQCIAEAFFPEHELSTFAFIVEMLKNGSAKYHSTLLQLFNALLNCSHFGEDEEMTAKGKALFLFLPVLLAGPAWQEALTVMHSLLQYSRDKIEFSKLRNDSAEQILEDISQIPSIWNKETQGKDQVIARLQILYNLITNNDEDNNYNNNDNDNNNQNTINNINNSKMPIQNNRQENHIMHDKHLRKSENSIIFGNKLHNNNTNNKNSKDKCVPQQNQNWSSTVNDMYLLSQHQHQQQQSTGTVSPETTRRKLKQLQPLPPLPPATAKARLDADISLTSVLQSSTSSVPVESNNHIGAFATHSSTNGEANSDATTQESYITPKINDSNTNNDNEINNNIHNNKNNNIYNNNSQLHHSIKNQENNANLDSAGLFCITLNAELDTPSTSPDVSPYSTMKNNNNFQHKDETEEDGRRPEEEGRQEDETSTADKLFSVSLADVVDDEPAEELQQQQQLRNTKNNLNCSNGVQS